MPSNLSCRGRAGLFGEPQECASRVFNGEAMIPGDGLRWENRRLVRVDQQIGEVAEVIDDPTRLLGVPDVEGDAGFKEER